MAFENSYLELLNEATQHLAAGFAGLTPAKAPIEKDALDAVRRVLLETAERLRGGRPHHHPLYAGEAIKPKAL